MKYPLLKGRDKPFYPKSGKKCSLCGESFRKDGIVYLAGGAVAACWWMTRIWMLFLKFTITQRR